MRSSTGSSSATASAWRYAIKLLETEPDFTVDESFEFDREHAPWAASQAELDELWRKRVKNDALSLMLTDKTWAETRDVLKKRYERVAKRSEQITADDVFENFMNAFAHVFDPHSSYFSPRNSEEYRIADEPVLRGHRRVAAVDRRLRDHHGNPARRFGAAERRAQGATTASSPWARARTARWSTSSAGVSTTSCS